jgi:hypothetical protein
VAYFQTTAIGILKQHTQTIQEDIESLNKRLRETHFSETGILDALHQDRKVASDNLKSIQRAIGYLSEKNIEGTLAKLTLGDIGKQVTVSPYDGTQVSGMLISIDIETESYRNHHNNFLGLTKVYSMTIENTGKVIRLENLNDNTKVIVHESVS